MSSFASQQWQTDRISLRLNGRERAVHHRGAQTDSACVWFLFYDAWSKSEHNPGREGVSGGWSGGFSISMVASPFHVEGFSLTWWHYWFMLKLCSVQHLGFIYFSFHFFCVATSSVWFVTINFFCLFFFFFTNYIMKVQVICKTSGLVCWW